MGLKLIGEVALDGSGFERGLNSMASSVKGFIAGAFGLYAIETIIRKTVDTNKELVNNSKRLGVGVEQLQVLEQAAKDSGKELGDVANMFAKIDQAREKALSGSPEGLKMLARFGQLGISREDLQNPSMTASSLVMGPIHQKAISMNQEDLGAILKSFGKGVEGLIPMLKTDFKSLHDKMQALGLLMDTKTAASLKILDEEFGLLGNIIAVKLGPILLGMAEGVFRVIGALASWWAWFKGLIGGGAEKAGAIMSATPGYGGWGPGQKEAMEKAVAMKGQTKDEALANAEAAFDKEAAKWNGWLDEIKAKFDKLAAELNKPEAPKFDVPESDEKEKAPKEFHEKAFPEKGDELIKVGNFLGSSKDSMESLAQKQVDLLQQIAKNTAPQSDDGGGDSSDDSGWAFGDDGFPMT